MYLGEAASDLHEVSFHSLNALPMYIHYTLDSLSVARLYRSRIGRIRLIMCYQVESDIICSQNGQLSKQWTIAKHFISRDFSGTSLVANLHAGSLEKQNPPVLDNPIFAKYANITYYNINNS